MKLLQLKLIAGAFLLALPVYLSGEEALAGATVCNNGAAATIDIGKCTVTAGLIPTTVSFILDNDRLELIGAAPTGAVTTVVATKGDVKVKASTSSASTYGIGGAGSLGSLKVVDGVTFNVGHDINFVQVTVGAGVSGVLNQSAGTLTTSDKLKIDKGGVFVQSGSGVINAAKTTIDTGGALTVINQGSGAITGAAAGRGTLTIGGNYNTDSALGNGGNSLSSIIVNDGVTLTLDQNASATTFTVGTGTSGIVNQSAGTLTATTLAIAAGGTVTQSGSGVINTTNTTLDTGGALTVINQGSGAIDGAAAGRGALPRGGKYSSDGGLCGSTALASITVNDGVTLTLDQNASATTFTVGTGTSGIVNQSAGTLTATNLTLDVGAIFTQSGVGAINATNTTLDTGGALTVVNQGSGAIDGAAAGRGALTIGGNYNTDSALGGTNSLASITVNDGVTLTLDQNASATTFTVGTGTSGIVNQSAGTLTATTLAVAAGGTVTQSGSGVINTTNTTLDTGGALTVINQGSGAIDGAAAGRGALTIGGNYNTDSALGGTNSLASITVNDGVTLTLDQNASATTFTVGNGTSGVVTHTTGILTATTLAINSGAIFNQSGVGAITAATTVGDGGTLNVTSAFTHTGALTVGGGTSGTLDLAGNTVTASSTVALNAGATLKTTINADTANDLGRIVATGAVTIDAGTTIDITVTPGTLTTGQTYVVVSGGGGGSINVPTIITDNNATYSFTGSTDGNSLTLTVSLATGQYSPNVTSSANALAAAGVLDQISTAGATGDISTVLTQLNTLSAAAQDTAIATTIPDVSGALTSTSISVQSLSLGMVTSRLAALRGSLDGTLSGVSSGDAAANKAIWGQAFGATAKQGRRAGFDGYDAGTGGIAFGGDTLLDNNDWIVGLAYSYALSNINYKGSNTGDGNDIESHQGTIYASLDGGAYYADVLGSVGRNNYDTTRRIVVGSLIRTAKGDFSALQYSAKIGGGYNVNLGNGLTLTPTASVQATRLSVDGYTETGAGSLNLSVKNKKYLQLQSGLGVKGTYAIKAGSGGMLSTSMHATWLYDVKSVRQESVSSYTGGGGAFTTEGPASAENAINFGASLNYELDTGLSIAATYDAEIKQQYLSHSATATARWEF